MEIEAIIQKNWPFNWPKILNISKTIKKGTR